MASNQPVHQAKPQVRWYDMHPGTDPYVTRQGKSVKKCSGSASPLNSAFSRISKPLSGVSPPISEETMPKWEKLFKESTVVCNQTATFNRSVIKIQDEVQDNLRVLYIELGKRKSSQKANKALLELKDRTVFQQNVNFVLGKSMQHMVDTIVVQAANMTLLCKDFYLKYLKRGVKPDTWCSLRNSPLHHSVLFADVAIAKAEEDITKSDTDTPNLVPVPVLSVKNSHFQPYQVNWNRGKNNKFAQAQDKSQDMPSWYSFGKQEQLYRGRGSNAPWHGDSSIRGGKGKQNK